MEAGIKDHRQLTRPGRFQRWYEQAIKAGEDLQKAHEREGLGRPHGSIDGESVTWDPEVDLDDEAERDGKDWQGRITEGGYCMPDDEEDSIRSWIFEYPPSGYSRLSKLQGLTPKNIQNIRLSRDSRRDHDSRGPLWRSPDECI
jgi:hypothetical protein